MKLQSEFSCEFLKTIFVRMPPLASATRTPSLRLCPVRLSTSAAAWALAADID